MEIELIAILRRSHLEETFKREVLLVLSACQSWLEFSSRFLHSGDVTDIWRRNAEKVKELNLLSATKVEQVLKMRNFRYVWTKCIAGLLLIVHQCISMCQRAYRYIQVQMQPANLHFFIWVTSLIHFFAQRYCTWALHFRISGLDETIENSRQTIQGGIAKHIYNNYILCVQALKIKQ